MSRINILWQNMQARNAAVPAYSMYSTEYFLFPSEGFSAGQPVSEATTWRRENSLIRPGHMMKSLGYFRHETHIKKLQRHKEWAGVSVLKNRCIRCCNTCKEKHRRQDSPYLPFRGWAARPPHNKVFNTLIYYLQQHIWVLTNFSLFIYLTHLPPRSPSYQHSAKKHADILSKPQYDAVFLPVVFLILPVPFCPCSNEGRKLYF